MKLHSLLSAIGGLLFVAGVFFALQGAGVIMWPAESFMLANREWVSKGLIIALAGAAVLLISRRMAKSG